MKLTLLSISGTGSRLRPRSSSSEVLLLRDPKTMLKIVELKLKLKLSDCIVKLKLTSNKASRLFRQVKSRHSWCNLIDVKECLFVCED